MRAAQEGLRNVERHAGAMEVVVTLAFEQGTPVAVDGVRGEVVVAPEDLSALANNVTVARILDAARESARTGRTVQLGRSAAHDGGISVFEQVTSCATNRRSAALEVEIGSNN